MSRVPEINFRALELGLDAGSQGGQCSIWDPPIHRDRGGGTRFAGRGGEDSVIPAPVRRLGGGQEKTAIVSNSATALEFGSVPSISTLCIHRLPYVWSKYKQPYNPVFHRSS